MNINEQFILESFNNKSVDAICFMLYIKKKYRKSILYNFTYASASRKLRLPIPTIKRYVFTLKKLGYCSITGKHLHFISTNKMIYKSGLVAKHLCTVKFDKNYSIRDIKSLLATKVLEMKARQIDFCIKGKTALRLLTNQSKIKALESKLPKNRIVVPENTITYSSVAHTLNLSKTGAYYLVNNAKSLGLLRTKTLVKRLGKFDKLSTQAMIDTGLGYFYEHGGFLFSILGSQYHFTKYPVDYIEVNKDCSKKEAYDIYLNWNDLDDKYYCNIM